MQNFGNNLNICNFSGPASVIKSNITLICLVFATQRFFNMTKLIKAKNQNWAGVSGRYTQYELKNFPAKGNGEITIINGNSKSSFNPQQRSNPISRLYLWQPVAPSGRTSEILDMQFIRLRKRR